MPKPCIKMMKRGRLSLGHRLPALCPKVPAFSADEVRLYSHLLSFHLLQSLSSRIGLNVLHYHTHNSLVSILHLSHFCVFNTRISNLNPDRPFGKSQRHACSGRRVQIDSPSYYSNFSTPSTMAKRKTNDFIASEDDQEEEEEAVESDAESSEEEKKPKSRKVCPNKSPCVAIQY